MRARHLLTTAAICLTAVMLTGCGSHADRESTVAVDPAAKEQPAPPDVAPETLAAWDTLTGDFQNVLAEMPKRANPPTTLAQFEKRFSHLLTDGVQVSDWDRGSDMTSEDGPRLCLTGPDDTYLTFAILATEDDDSRFTRTWGTGGCDYESGDIIAEYDNSAVHRGILDSLRSDTMAFAVAVETWATDHPGRLPTTTDPLVAEAGLELSEGNYVYDYAATADPYTYRVCVHNVAGSWASLKVVNDEDARMSWPVQAVGLDGDCTYDEMSDEAYDDLLASLPPNEESVVRGAELVPLVPTLDENPLEVLFSLD